ncbi:MFS transporter [Micromonospora sp. WMMD882]|uniref:MFS transporter n=1 Tax=Micromonospora sp. WMMD882 TaxID=3015151 RepID=UPI00248BE8A5|nr:MFS transporter [Micromonospora sp. WMMD882]WBB77730.1 MFS transporter [Micromonospora sp. WMMD882]
MSQPTTRNAGPSVEAPAKRSLVTALHDRTMRVPLLWSVVGRLPLYLVGIALVVSTASRDANYLSAGLLLAGYTLGIAVVAPFVARRVDRYGQPPVLLVTGVTYPLALTGFVYADHAPLATQLACIVVAGAANPPISGCIRSLWRASGSSLEQVGLSIEAVLGEVFRISGPLLLSVLLFWADAATALVVGGLLAGAGAIGFATTGAARSTRTPQARHADSDRRDRLGAFRSAGLVRLLAVLVSFGVALGIYNVAVPAFVQDHGADQDVGLIFGVWGVGGIIGGLWYGRHTLRRSTEAAFATGTLAMCACTALVTLAWDNWSLGVVLLLLGAVTAPVTVISYQLVSRTARTGYVTEAFTWAITVSLGGSALGSQIGGLVLDAFGTGAAFVGVAVVMLLVATGVYVVRHRLAEPAATASTG